MLPKLEHYPVNWVDGMKIARKHFTDFEHFVSDHLRDSSAVNLTNYNYGLLPSDAPAFGIQVITDRSQNVRVQLSNCRAVTGAGCRIELVNQPLELATSLQAILDKYNMPMADELQFLIVLSVDLYTRQPEGVPANNEPFPRPPFTIPTYTLNILPSQQQGADRPAASPLNGQNGQATPTPAYPSASFESYHIVVGQLLAKYGILSNDESFIPSCAAISAHTGLLAWTEKMNKTLSEVQRDAYQIVAKVVRKRRTEQAYRAGPLAEQIRILAESVAGSLDDALNHLQFGGREQSPMEYIRYVTRATRLLKTTLDCLCEEDKNSPSLGRELVLPYFQSWTNIEPATVETAINEVITRQYRHGQLQQHLPILDRCWEAIRVIFRRMTELEYIGQENTDYDFDTQRRSTHRADRPADRVNDPFGGGYSFQ
ncbi:hypothetical protein [uncultured Fibrella sp.]|uniref:hypothetical protein n=1 Tax=uncultured Fibrella sp. TaxID=1284596 RepID=UPI0035CB73F8